MHTCMKPTEINFTIVIFPPKLLTLVLLDILGNDYDLTETELPKTSIDMSGIRLKKVATNNSRVVIWGRNHVEKHKVDSHYSP